MKNIIRYLVFVFPLFMLLFSSNLTAYTRPGDFLKIVDSSAYLPPYNGITVVNSYAYGPAMIYEDGVYHCWFGSTPAEADGSAPGGWDYIRYTSSTDGVNWTTPVIVLRPSNLTEEKACCDPSVVFFQGYYYLYYSGHKDGVGTRQFVARSVNPAGPYSKYTTSGTWKTTTSNPKPIIDPVAPTTNKYGSGQASVVYRNGTLFMWHTDDMAGSSNPNNPIVYRTSTDGVTWSSLALTQISTPYGYIMSIDVKWNPYQQLWVMYADKNRHERPSESIRYFSRDGIRWAGPVNVVDLPDFSHNGGILGNRFGHVTRNNVLIVGYGCPFDMNKTEYTNNQPPTGIVPYCWGFWDMYGHKWTDLVYVKGDFDGDGKLDPAMVDPDKGRWHVRSSLTGQEGVPGIPWGWEWGGWTLDCKLVCADYDGDGTTDQAMVDTAAAGGWRWYIIGSTSGLGTVEIPWGWQWASLTKNHEIVIGDFDGDGKADRTIVDRSLATWYCIPSSGPDPFTWGWQWSGLDPWQPLVCADYDGDGKTDRAFIDTTAPGGVKYYVLGSTSGSGTAAIPWGWQWAGTNGTQYHPIVEDWDGDGLTDCGLIRANVDGTGNTWHIATSTGSCYFTSGWKWANPMTDYHQVVAGDYDGDGKADRAIVDVDLGGGTKWYILGSQQTYPVPWGWQMVPVSVTCNDYLLGNDPVSGDISGPDNVADCKIDFQDLAALASNWLTCNGPLPADCTDLHDFAALAGNWLFCYDPVESHCK